jgi:hypothetical protein
MKRRFILYRRKRGGMFYVEDTETHKQESTGTKESRRGHGPAQRPQRIRPATATEPPNRQGLSGRNRFGAFKTDLAGRVQRHY